MTLIILHIEETITHITMDLDITQVKVMGNNKYNLPDNKDIQNLFQLKKV